jgi:hypothetical protein
MTEMRMMLKRAIREELIDAMIAAMVLRNDLPD